MHKFEVQVWEHHFWSERYDVSTVGLNEAIIKRYIQKQKKADILQDKLSVGEYEESLRVKDESYKRPFRGSDESVAMWLERCHGKPPKVDFP